jgi:hypothetical protein
MRNAAPAGSRRIASEKLKSIFLFLFCGYVFALGDF